MKHTGKDNPFNSVRILKAKIKDKVHIEYEIEHNKITDSITLESEDEALPEFKNALQEMRGAVCEICELDKDNASRIKVLGVSLSYEGEPPNRRMGAVVTATRRLEKTNGTMLLNTPYLLEATNDKKNSRGVMPAELENQIGLMINEARRYLNGERAQTKIDFPPKEE
jgi:hypothetical protein